MGNDIEIKLVTLEQKVESITKQLRKLDDIDKHLEQISKTLTTHHIDVELIKKDILYLHNSHKELKVEVDNNQKNIDSLTKKLTAILTIVNFVGWLIGWAINYILK